VHLHGFIALLNVLVGSPTLTGRAATRAFHQYVAARGLRQVEIMCQHQTLMENELKFVLERIERLRKTAFALKDAAETVLAKVQHMEAAAARFKERVEKKKSARTTGAH
jgi:hypothetical protein